MLISSHCSGLVRGGRSFINREGIVCFSPVTLTMAAPLYYEEDKENFPMNDLGLFTLTNHQGKRHFKKKSSEKSVLCIWHRPVICNYRGEVFD